MTRASAGGGPHLAREGAKATSRKDGVSRARVSIQGHSESMLAQGTGEVPGQALRLSTDLTPPEVRCHKGLGLFVGVMPLVLS